MQKVEIFIIDDHPMFLEGIRKSFDKENDGVFIGGWAKSIAEARELLKNSKAGVIFLDLVLPGESGVDFCCELKSKYPEKKVVALTGETDPGLLYNAWVNGADAIMSKLSDKNQLLDVIEGVLSGKKIIGNGVSTFFDFKNASFDKPFHTKREFEVMNLLVAGYSRKEAALKLNVTLDTIHKHSDNVFKKFDVNSLPKYILLVKGLNSKE